MRKAILLLFLIYIYIPGQAQIIKDTFPYQEDYSNYVPKQPNNDSLTIIEKVYLHTDRTYYFPGDDIWFKAYLIDAADMAAHKS